MGVAGNQPERNQEWVKILDHSEACHAGERFRVTETRLQYRRADGAMSEPITRYCFEPGPAVAVLLYDPQRDSVVLVRQFRYPVLASLEPEAQQGEGARRAWLLEAIAGKKEEELSEDAVARKEAMEEAGFDVTGELTRIASVYPSPGSLSEWITIFLAEVDSQQRGGEGGGLASEGEDTELVILPLSQALQMIASGEICDAKTVIALQYLALRKAGGGV